MNAQEIRDRIVRLGPWHHDVEVVPGIRTGEPAPPGAYPPELGTPTVITPERGLAWLVAEVYPGGLAGRSFLDCACNAGGYLFAATRLGAGRCFGFDVRKHWIDQARFLAEHLPSENIEFATLDLASLAGLNLGAFDVTLFNGIFYHLPDPIAGLRIAADHTRELLVVNTDTLDSPGDSLVINRESEVEVMSGVHGLAWLPTSYHVLRDILGWCGFPHTRVRFERKVAGNRRRIEIIAAREQETFLHYDAGRPQREPRRLKGWVRLLFRRSADR
jgi:tRNA (mo5U34)-methyltransferase